MKFENKNNPKQVAKQDTKTQSEKQLENLLSETLELERRLQDAMLKQLKTLKQKISLLKKKQKREK